MGIDDRDYSRDEYGSSGYGGGYAPGGYSPGGSARGGQFSMVTTLLIANVVVFVVALIVNSPDGNPILKLLALQSGDLVRPWRWFAFLTYGFCHDLSSIRHILFNMMGLFFLGRAVEARLGRYEFLYFYLASIIFSGLVASLHLELAGTLFRLVGASGAVVAVVLLFVLWNPKATLLIWFVVPVPAWLVGVLLVGQNLYGAFADEQTPGAAMTAFDAHLAGLAFAAAYFLWRWNLTSFVARLGKWKPLQWFARPALRVHRPDISDDREADRILQKLHERGESSLTARERNILEAYSRRLRRERGS